jgi:hypothetical protein
VSTVSPYWEHRLRSTALLIFLAEEQFSETFLTPLAGPMHLALLAAERFYSTHKRWPGTKELSDMAEDQREMEETVKGIVSPLVEGFEELDDGYVESITEVYAALSLCAIPGPRTGADTE